MNDPLPLASDSDSSPVPVYNCRIILHKDSSTGQLSGRVANLGGLSAKGTTERDVLMQLAKHFKKTVADLTEQGRPIPWIDPPESPGPDESERFLPVHL